MMRSQPPVNPVDRPPGGSGRKNPLILRRRRSTPRWIAAVASSTLLARLARLGSNLLLSAGVALALFGLVLALSGFTADLTALTRYAGGSDALAASTGKMVRQQVLGWFGVGGAQASLDAARPEPKDGPPPEYLAARATLTSLQTAVAALPEPGAQPAPTAAETPVPIPVTGEEGQVGMGFIPYRVEPSELSQHAPALPNPAVNEPTPLAPTAEVIEPTRPPPGPPTRILISRIGLDAPVELSLVQTIYAGGQTFQQWEAPRHFAAGWQEGSALAGAPGNIVINGHHNIYEMVFARLLELERGDEIILFSGDQAFPYRVSQVMTLEEQEHDLYQRQENARWILSSDDERLTLVTCWPPASNTHRLLVIAVPGN